MEIDNDYICIDKTNMTLQQLEYLVALDNHRNFVKAAEACRVTQPTLSMMVHKLEEEIGIRLFDRSGKPIQVTAAGVNVIRKAHDILGEVKKLKAMVSHETESMDGEFTLGIIPTLAPYVLPRFLPVFTKTHPRTHLRIREMQTSAIIDGLSRGMLDMGLAVTPLHEQVIREVPLFNEPFLVYLPKEHVLSKKKEIAPEELHLDEMLLLEEGHCFREQALAICSRGKKRFHRGFEYESGSIEAMKALVKKGIGLTLVPELSVSEKELLENTRRFKKPEPVREVSLLVNRNFSREALIEELHSVITQSVPKGLTTKGKFKRVKWR